MLEKSHKYTEFQKKMFSPRHEDKHKPTLCFFCVLWNRSLARSELQPLLLSGCAAAAGLLSVSSVTAGYIWSCRGIQHLNPHLVSPVSGPPVSLPLLTSLPSEPHLHLSTWYLNLTVDERGCHVAVPLVCAKKRPKQKTHQVISFVLQRVKLFSFRQMIQEGVMRLQAPAVPL